MASNNQSLNQALDSQLEKYHLDNVQANSKSKDWIDAQDNVQKGQHGPGFSLPGVNKVDPMNAHKSLHGKLDDLYKGNDHRDGQKFKRIQDQLGLAY